MNWLIISIGTFFIGLGLGGMVENYGRDILIWILKKRGIHE